MSDIKTVVDLYGRVSTQEQAREGYSIEEYKVELEERIAALKLKSRRLCRCIILG